MTEQIVRLTYPDAHYAYKTNLKSPKGVIVSYGVIAEKTSEHIDLKQAWVNDNSVTVFGVVIPIGVLEGEPNRDAIKRDHYEKGDTVAVYWNDIFAYNERYKGPHRCTHMLTEGVLIKETDSYLLLGDPETLNLTESRNHPMKKPKLYYIPMGMVIEIRSITK